MPTIIGNATDKDLYRQGFLSAYVEVTDACNMDCEHCLRKNGREPITRDPKLEELAKIRDNLESSGLPNLFYELSGGEFLMRKDWRQVFRLFLETGRPTYVLTNATLVDEAAAEDIERLDELYAGQIIINSSIDSHIPAIHNKTRSHFYETVRGLRLLKSTGAKLKVNITLNRNNLSYIVDTADFIAENFTTGISLSVLRPVFPITEENSGLFISYEEALEAAGRVTKRGMQRGWDVYSTFHDDGMSYCDAGINHLLITTAGDVTPCYSLRQSGFFMGNLYREEFNTILERILRFNAGRDRRVLLCEHLDEFFGSPPVRLERTK